MENIEIIKNNILEIIKNSEELQEITKKFNVVLSELNKKDNEINHSRTELLNNLLRYPKKKILFIFNFKSNQRGKNLKYTIGLNESGLGIKNEYENNLRNIMDYWIHQLFIKMSQDENFRKLLFEHIKEEHKGIITKILDYKKIEIPSKEFTIKDKVRICLGNSVIFQINETTEKENASYFVSTYLVDKNSYVRYDFSDLKNMSILIEHKKEILEYLQTELKAYQKLRDDINENSKEIIDALKPYQALKQI
jgi:cytochrome oxidase Cu insertion factor (SCO1/SenC/PrrC family)